jgi:hypothetical protein
MPLTPATEREEIHHRRISMKAYRRKDGRYDIEANLVDTKPFPFQRVLAATPAPAGATLHDLWIRLVLDETYTVRAVEAASDTAPFPACKQAETTLSVLVGERVRRGWTRLVKERLRGAASCTHLAEMLIPLATTALQGIRGLDPERVHERLADGTPAKLDSCYAYASTGDLVRQLWPQHHRAQPGPREPAQ